MQMPMDHLTRGVEGADRDGVSLGFGAWVQRKIRIGWVSVSRLARECMMDVVSRACPIFDIIPFSTTDECIKNSLNAPDLIVYHSRGYGVTDLQDLIELRRAFPSVKLLVLSDSDRMEPDLMHSIMVGGTAGIIQTGSNSLDMLISAIRLVSSGGTFVSREFFMTSATSSPPADRRHPDGWPRLTERERTVLELIRQGKPNKIIAYELKLSLCTVKIHARNLIRKMGAANRTQVAMNADKVL